MKPDFTYTYNNCANAMFAIDDKAGACEWWQKALDKGYVYRPEWKEQYDIDDPVELIKKHCK